MSRIFVSHTTLDDPFVNELAEELRRAGFTTFVDHQDIKKGRWDDIVMQELESCDQMVAVISPESIRSPNCRDEWDHFINAKKEIIPILYRGDKVFFRLNRMQHVNMRDATQRAQQYATLKEYLSDHVISTPEIPQPSDADYIKEQGLTSRLYAQYPIKQRPDKFIGIATGNIVTIGGVDVLVNSENQRLEMSQSHAPTISAAIRTHAITTDANGKVIWQVRKELEKIHEERFNGEDVPPATVIVTPPGNLSNNRVRHLLHVVSVIGDIEHHITKPVSPLQLRLCIAHILQQIDLLSVQDGIPLTNVIIPLLATGRDIQGTISEFAPLLVSRAIEYLIEQPNSPLKTVYFIAYQPEHLKELEAVFATFEELDTPIHPT